MQTAHGLRLLGERPRDAAGILVVVGAVGGTALVGGLRFGPPGLLAPLVVGAALALLVHPAMALALLAAVVVLCEGDELGFAPQQELVYEPLVAGLSPVDGLLVLALAAVVVDIARRGEPLRLPGPLALPLVIFALAGVAGVVAGSARGAPLGEVLYEGRSIVYLALVAILAVNVFRSRADVVAGLALAAALATVKAAIGLFAFLAGEGRVVDGSALTYYEPLANLLILMALVAVAAAARLGIVRRLPVWLVLAWPLMLACLVLSFRRSFWIGLVLAGLLLLTFTSTPAGRRMLMPAAVVLISGLWALAAIGFEAQGPLVDRVRSLQPSRIEANAEDRYRIDELANVVAELRAHPVAGLGLAVDWSSAERPLPVEHADGRRYVHGVALWHWLKLGLLGLVAYLGLLVASIAMAWRTSRGHPDPLLRAVALTLVCSLIALAAIESTASYTAVESRVSILLGVVLGMLAVVYREVPRSSPPSSPSTRRAIA